MLSIRDLTVAYGKHRVLHRVSLDVRSGEVLALIGPNGAGKSTLIRAISCVIPARGGKIQAGGKDLSTLPPMQRARLLAVVPQAVSLPAAFSVWEMVRLGRTPFLNFLGQTSPRDDELTRQALERVEALALAGRLVGELSGGEQQRVLLARALAQTTPILLLDEPTAHLDLQFQVRLMETVTTLARRDNLAVLIALHDLNLAAHYAGRVALLVEGRIKACGSPHEVLTSERISEAYHLPVKVVEHPFLDAPLVLPDDRKIP